VVILYNGIPGIWDHGFELVLGDLELIKYVKLTKSCLEIIQVKTELPNKCKGIYVAW
jgi:hypothetical protein